MNLASPRTLAPSLVVLLAAGAGLSVAGLYYNQPILGAIAADLGATPAEVGLVPMLTQLGYGAGILFFAPLGDRLDRRRVILAKLIALGVALCAAGLAPSIAWLAGASLAIGMLATAAQDYVPAAATLAPIGVRGRIIGTVMTGLLLGILLSRLVSGVVSDQLGWRAVFFGAAGSIAALAAVTAVGLPSFEPATKESYGSLLRSMAVLARDLAPLRRAALTQGLLSIAFSGFWSTLALALVAPPYRLGSTAAGAFGLAGAAGALIAPLAGAIADKRGPVSVIRIGTCLVVGAFLLMAVWQGSNPRPRHRSRRLRPRRPGVAHLAPDDRVRPRSGGAQPGERGARERDARRDVGGRGARFECARWLRMERRRVARGDRRGRGVRCAGASGATALSVKPARATAQPVSG